MGGAIDDNVIKHEFTRLRMENNGAEVNEEVSEDVGAKDLPDTAEHLLLFIFSTWDRK